MDKLEKELYEIIIREIYINSDTAEDLAKVIANKIKPRKLRAVEQLRAADGMVCSAVGCNKKSIDVFGVYGYCATHSPSRR